MRHLFRMVIFVVVPLVYDPAFAADATHGKLLAEQWCASCHLISPHQRQASADVPSFATIARQPGFDGSRLAFFLLEPHPKMPSMSLTRIEAADLAAYIESFSTK